MVIKTYRFLPSPPTILPLLQRCDQFLKKPIIFITYINTPFETLNLSSNCGPSVSDAGSLIYKNFVQLKVNDVYRTAVR